MTKKNKHTDSQLNKKIVFANHSILYLHFQNILLQLVGIYPLRVWRKTSSSLLSVALLSQEIHQVDE